MAKKGKLSLQELTELELYKIETEEKVAKYEKEISKYKKNIANLKKKDRLFSKSISLCESKITRTKENSMNSLLFLCENIKEVKKNFSDALDGLESDEQYEYFSVFVKEFEYIMSTIYDVCNKIEEDTVFTKADREVISNKFEMSDLAEVDNEGNFNKLAEEFRKNIMMRKTNKEKIKEEKANNFYEIENEDSDNSENEVLYNSEYYNEQMMVKNKFNKIFYEAPTEQNQVISNIAGNGLFDFNEALNPTLSLSDIMNDLIGDDEYNDGDDDELDSILPPKPAVKEQTPKKSNGFEDYEYLGEEDDDGFSYAGTNNMANYDETDEFDDEDDYLDDEEKFKKQKQAKMEQIESKFNSNSKIQKREIDDSDFSNQNTQNQNYEAKFTYLQNMLKDNK